MARESGTSLVLLRDRREEVVQLLTDNFANDLLGIERFEERIGLAHQAQTVAALDALVSDLAALPADAARLPLATLEPDVSLGREPRSSRIAAIFSSLERRGAWAVPARFKVSAVFGNAELDFRQARFAPGVTEVEVSAVFGNIEILVPPNLAVECEGTAIFASFEQTSGAVADPERPVLRVTGRAVFGNVEIATRPPGDAWRDRAQRRALTAPSAPALPPHEEP